MSEPRPAGRSHAGLGPKIARPSVHVLDDADQLDHLRGMSSASVVPDLHGSATEESPGRRVRAAVLVGVALVLAAAALDGTIISVALPTIRSDLATGPEAIQWLASVYFLAAAIVLVPAGRLADLLGARRVLAIGGAVYVVGSVLGAVAPAATWIVVGRAIQGAGSGITAPAAVLLVAAVFGEKRRGRAIGTVAAMLAAASALGPVVGGALTDTVGWRLIFVNHAVMVALGVLLTRRAPRRRRSATSVDLDPRGTVAWAGAVLGFQLAILHWGDTGMAGRLALVGTGAACAWALVRVERRRDEPLFDLSLLRIPEVAASVVSKSVVAFAFYGNIFYFTLFLQSEAGYSAFAAGLILLPSSLVGVAASPFVGRAVDRSGAGPVLSLGTALIAAALFALAVVNETSSVVFHIMPGLALNGLGYAMVSVAAKSAPLAAVAEDRRGRATALVSVVSKAASGFGVTVATGLFNLYSGAGIDNGLGDYSLSGTSTMRTFIRKHLGASDLRDTLSSGDVSQAGFSSVSQAATVIEDCFAFSMSLMLASMGLLVLLGAVAVVVLFRRASTARHPRRRPGR